VIAGAVIVSGLFAAVAAVVLSVQQTQITSTFGLQETIYVLAGVVVGGLNRPIPATLGGFSIGFAIGILGSVLPYNQAQYLPSFVFAAVIVVLLVQPNGLFARSAAVERV
jgi:branched-chain amino acid transport system permease protein